MTVCVTELRQQYVTGSLAGQSKARRRMGGLVAAVRSPRMKFQLIWRCDYGQRELFYKARLRLGLHQHHVNSSRAWSLIDLAVREGSRCLQECKDLTATKGSAKLGTVKTKKTLATKTRSMCRKSLIAQKAKKKNRKTISLC